MEEYQVLIPDESYDLINFNQDNLPGVAVLNSALRDFEPKEVFSWHCSIMLEFEKLIENGMPSQEERDVIDKFGDFLNEKIKGSNKEKPNALFNDLSVQLIKYYLLEKPIG